MDRDDRDFLSRVPLLRQLAPHEIERLTRAMARRPVRAGEVLADLGEAGTDAYIVRAGNLVLELPVADRASRVVARMGPGTLLGEVCLVEPALRTLRIRAESEALVYVIDGQRFGVLCDVGDPGAHKLLRAIALTLCDRLRQTTARLQDELKGDASADSEDIAIGLFDPIVADRPWERLKRLFGRSG